MDRNELLNEIIRQVIAEMGATADVGAVKRAVAETLGASDNKEYTDLTSKESKGQPGLKNPEDMDALLRMKSKTPARIGVGRAGGRLTTKSLLTLRADHAAAKDAVFMDVNEDLLKRLGMFTVQTKCVDKNQFLTRPDLGRTFSDEALNELRSKCKMNPQVQIYASDGLSSTAIEANLENILPAITDGLKSKGISVGTPFFVKYGRVATEDIIAETLSAEVVCVLLGERPGLATAESMSAYIAYKATVGMPEARRTVVSNIHKDGIAAVEAGAYIADLIEKILKAQKSGVELQS
ncbi:MAG: ethanolamine ammonia-lyase subunit EutC [Clostridia bacterium]|nr:ethanolamine ammonia-lyase subunit EutC [Clostridia bacterium]